MEAEESKKVVGLNKYSQPLTDARKKYSHSNEVGKNKLGRAKKNRYRSFDLMVIMTFPLNGRDPGFGIVEQLALVNRKLETRKTSKAAQRTFESCEDGEWVS